MNTLEILYQAFRVRYSLNQLQQLLDRGCRIALLGPDDAAKTLRSYFGEPVPPIGGGDPSEDLFSLSWEMKDSDIAELKTCDACLVLFPEGPPEVDTLSELATKIPIHVKTLFLCLVDDPKGGSFHEKDLTLPTVLALPRAHAQERFLKLVMVGLPQVVVILARHWTNVRRVFCKTLTRRTALRNGIRSGVSSLPLAAVPVIGPVLKMLATSAETMMLTSSQLRLSFVIAAAHNRPLDFFDRISELWPIVGTAFGFRGMSRRLVKILPGFSPAWKAGISFGGTYAIGEACRLYYEHGLPSDDEVRRELLRRSHEEGAKEAARLFRKVLAGQSLEEIEDDEEGAEVEKLVEDLTKVESSVDELRPRQSNDDRPPLEQAELEQAELEPTVEMDAVVPPKKSLEEKPLEEKLSKQASTSVEPSTSSKKKKTRTGKKKPLSKDGHKEDHREPASAKKKSTRKRKPKGPNKDKN